MLSSCAVTPSIRDIDMNIEETVNSSPGDDDASIPTDAAEMALKRSIHYVSDDVGASDEVGPPAEMPKNPKRRRGDGLHWTFNRKFVSMEDAMLEYCKEKLIERGLSKGRITRGKTIVYYYNCTMMTCGCMKKWRLRSSQTSLEFLEEETSEEHSNHNKHLRFEGRGISFAQEAIVEEAMASNLFKTTEIVNHFRYVAANGLKNDPDFIAVDIPKSMQIANYVRYKKSKIAETSPSQLPLPLPLIVEPEIV